MADHAVTPGDRTLCTASLAVSTGIFPASAAEHPAAVGTQR